MSTRLDMEASARPTAGQEARTRLLAAMPVRERRMELAGVSTAVLEAGDGPPVVLLHGPAASAAHWIRVIPRLATTHRVVAPDLPGQGASEVIEGPLDDARVLGWLDALIERTCPSPPALVGYALGGAIAARYAADRSDRISRLVLVDAFGLVGFAPAPEFAAAIHEYLAGPTERTHERLWRHCALDLDALRDGMGERWAPFEAYNLDRARTPTAAAALGALMGAFGMPAITSVDLDRIVVPTTLIWGRHDLATPLSAAEAASARHGWPLHVIEACADDPPIEQPEAFLRALGAALDGGNGAGALAGDAVEDLRRRLHGPLLLPADAGFGDATRLWNGLIAKSPALVVQPTGAADVAAAVDFARERGVALSVRGGGHNIAGTALADGGLTVDMSLLRSVRVDPRARTAVVGAGCLLGDVDREAQRHGLATPLGFISEVGVAGLTLGGGLGYLTRRFGWTVDNLLEVEIVTADGRVRRASRDEHEDLFWAVRGAGANLGVVTSFTFRLHEVGPTVHGGLIAWPFARAGEILRAYRTITAEAPRELAAWLVFRRAPHAPFVPEAARGERICAMSVCYSGDPAGADEALAPIRALGGAVVDLLRRQPYTAVQSYLDGSDPKGEHYYWKTEFAAELSDGLLAAWLDLAAECPIREAQLGFLHLGGALNERAPDDGVVGNRDARFACGLLGKWSPADPEADAHRRWIRDAWTRLRPFSTGATYINFQTADEGEDRIRATYGANFDRLVEVKRRYDPGNLFRSNRNVRPGAGGPAA
jgi:FAD/FMN-containing dehydrogenase/pimeloyl-ACP methyl ester carboxylesterase